MVPTPATAALVDEVGVRVAGLAALIDHPGYVKDWIMGTNTDRWIAERAGYEPAAALAVIAGLALALAAFVVWRYRRST
jgi:hypothetical protein